jgi:hypothetical protein
MPTLSGELGYSSRGSSSHRRLAGSAWITGNPQTELRGVKFERAIYLAPLLRTVDAPRIVIACDDAWITDKPEETELSLVCLQSHRSCVRLRVGSAREFSASKYNDPSEQPFHGQRGESDREARQIESENGLAMLR